MTVSSLGYAAFNVSDKPAWTDLLTSVFGLQMLEREDGGEDSGAVDVRLDDYHHRITLYPESEDGVAVLGWEVNSREKLDALAEKLRAQGISVEEGSAELCDERKMAEIYRFTEPHLDVATEIAYGPIGNNATFEPSRDIAPLNVGSDVGLGHVVFWTADLKATVNFYVDVMGFKVSDTMAWDDNDAVFLHCNKRHHTLAVMAEAEGRPAGALGHIMLESTSLDDVGTGYDIVRNKNIPLALEPGKHTNDLMQSFYLKTPSGFWMEYGYGGRLIESDDWEVEHYDAPMLWGHRMAQQ